MAEAIDYSPTFLSAVEIGEKTIPHDLVDKVVGFLRKHGIGEKALMHVRVAADRTRRAVDVSNLNRDGREVVATFARQWGDLDQPQREQLLQMARGWRSDKEDQPRRETFVRKVDGESA